MIKQIFFPILGQYFVFVPDFVVLFCLTLLFLRSKDKQKLAVLTGDASNSTANFYITDIGGIALCFSMANLFILDLTLDDCGVFNGLLVSSTEIFMLKFFYYVFAIMLIPFLYNSQWHYRLQFTEYIYLYSLSVIAGGLLFHVNHLLVFYLLVELQVLCFYILTVGRGNKNLFAIEGAIKYFILGSFAAGIFLLGCSFIYFVVGTLSLTEIQQVLFSSLNFEGFKLDTLRFGIFLVFILIFFKLGCAPFHFWTVDVYDGTPTSSTIIFSIIPKLPLVCFTIRFFSEIGTSLDSYKYLLLGVGLASIVFGVLGAFVQRRIKRLILYSSVVQMGFIILCIAPQSYLGYVCAFAFTLVYILLSILFWQIYIMVQEYYERVNHIRENGLTPPLYIATLKQTFAYTFLLQLIVIFIFFTFPGNPPFIMFLYKVHALLTLFGFPSELNRPIEVSYVAGIISLVLFLTTVAAYYYLEVIKKMNFERDIILDALKSKGRIDSHVTHDFLGEFESFNLGAQTASISFILGFLLISFLFLIM